MTELHAPVRFPRPHRAGWRRRTMLATAALLTAVLVVDPFGLGGVSGELARAGEVVEDRGANFDTALDAVSTDDAVPATDITGSWPGDSDAPLAVMPAVLPEPAEATVAVADAAGTPVELGGMAVEVATAEGELSPDAVTLRVEDEATTGAMGVTGVVIDVADATDGGTAGDPAVELTVSYAGFAGLVGGDWSSRLRMAYIPDCAAETPDAPECQIELISSVNDPVTQTVTGVVPVDTADATVGQTASLAEPMAMSRAVSAASGGSVAVAAGVSGSGGDWSQTGLPASSSWGTSGNTGAFTWSYPLTVPAPSAGPAPELTLSYSSAVSDGRVPSANNQSGWIGEGFDLTSSYIERQYVPCASDTDAAGANNAGRDSGDLCWGPQNATLVFKGAATPLVYDSAAKVWRSKAEDGTRVQRTTGGWHSGDGGEYWKVTTADGTQYFFGRGKVTSSGTDLKSAWTVPVYGNHASEPCYAAPGDGGFAASDCTQVWRWNLDHVVDPSGNTMTYTYATETNHYVADYTQNTGWSTTGYVSGGRLANIQYGTHEDGTGTAPFRVTFSAQARCLTDVTKPTSLCAGGHVEADKTKWLDTPTDLQCSASSTECQNVVPVFFDTTRLTKVTAQSWDGSAYRDVDSWAFSGRFVGEGDADPIATSQSVVLRLDAVTRTGHGGTATGGDDITLLPVSFGYMSLPNRVDSVTDGQSGLWRPRVITVRTDSGGQVHAAYREAECTPGTVPAATDAGQQANGKLCYLVKWQPEGESQPANHWFHKYVVESLVEDAAPQSAGGDDLITGSMSKTTRYAYLGGAEWAKPTGPLVEADEATYSEFRGFAQVETILGEGDEQATVERATYFRGTGAALTAGPTGHTVTVTDRDEYAGQVFATRTLNGSTAVSETIRKPAAPVTVATGVGVKSTRIPATTTYGFTFRADGAVAHRTSTTVTNDDAGLPVTVEDHGDLATDAGADDVCTKTTYRRDQAYLDANMLSYATKTETYAGSCDTTPTAGNLISRDTAKYDAAGRVTETLTADPSDPSADITRTTTGYDPQGRVVSVRDAAGNTTTTKYTPDTGGQVAEIVTTSPDPDGAGPVAPFLSKQTFNPRTGRPISSTDQNGLITTGTYDAVGRLTSLRHPQHADSPHPSVEYEYTVAPNGLNAVLTRTLAADGQRQHTSVVLYDGMLRPFQQQVEGANANTESPVRMVSHTTYDSAGRVQSRTSPWPAEGEPAATAVTPIVVPPSHTTFEYDLAGRVTDEIFWVGTDSNPDYEKWRTTTVYDGHITLTLPPAGGVPVETVTDARGRTTELREYVRDPDTHAGADTAAEVRALVKQTTRYTYDPAGQLVTMTNPTGDDWTYEYDIAGQQVSATDPDGGTTTSAYDRLGQVTTRTDGNGDTVAYTYDPLGRTLTVRDGSVTGPIRAEWKYDTAALTGGGVALGQVSSATRNVGTHKYVTRYDAYDTAYRPTRTSTVLPADSALHALAGKTYTTDVAYTADGQVEQITYPQVANGNSVVLGKEIVTTWFDDASMPSWMGGGFGWGVYVADAEWNSDGTPHGFDLGNTYGAAVTYEREDGTNRLQEIRLDRERVSGTEVALAYGYDDAGNVTSITDTPTATEATGNTDAQCFQYDGLRRLQSSWTTASACTTAPGSIAGIGGPAPYWTEYTYDPLGNRTRKTEHATGTVITYQHGAGDAGPHQLTSQTTTSGGVSVTTGYEWDDAGNQIARTTAGEQQALAWDREGELSSITGGETNVSNVYDANGTRLVRVDDDAVTVFLPGGQEITATDATVSATRWYTFAGTTVAVRTGVGLGGVTSVVTDHNGTPVAYVHNTDWTSAVQRVRTDPFGGVRADQQGVFAGRGFLGAPADSTGLTLLGARYYDPGTGTFVSPDPLLDPGVPAQFNAYVYAGNNPVTWADPSGLSWLGDAFNAVSGFVKKHQAEIGGFVAGALVTAGCLAVTAGAGSVGCLVAGGAVAGAVTNVWRQAQSGKKFDVASFATDTLIGGALGFLGPVAGAAGRFIAPVASKAAGAVANALRPVANKATTAVRSAATSATGGGSRAASLSARPSMSSMSRPGTGASCAINSFTPGTLVLLVNGAKAAIEDVRLGDLILATDPTTGETTAEPVIATITGTGEKDLVTLTITTDTGTTGEVTATTGHPFWVPDRAEWVDAGNLVPGDWLQTSAGTWVQITAIEHDQREQQVHNLTIANAHTYYTYAGNTPVLNHNCGGGSGGGAVGFSDDAVGSAFEGMRSGGGHAVRHLRDEGLIPNSGSLDSQVAAFRALLSPVLSSPSQTFSWKLGDTLTRGFAGNVGGSPVVAFVALQGKYQGRVLSAVVPNAGQIAMWGLR